MASSNTNLKVLQHCQISPPQGSVPSTILPLTFLDIPWLLFSPNQPLFFFDFPHFTQNILSNLKHSLSLTLEHFFLLAGNLVVPPQPSKPHFSYTEGDSVSLIIAESNVGDFSFLSCHEPRNIQPFHQLVPQLTHHELVDSSDTKNHPLLAIQITIFPGFGICLGFALRQVAADGRTFDNFLKTWASICKSCSTPQMVMLSKFSPCYDRALILDPRGLEQIFLKQWRYFKSQHHQEILHSANNGCTSIIDEIIVRATFVIGPTEMERIKGWITTRSVEVFGSTRLYLSPYVLVCAFVWVCWSKCKTHLAHIEHFLEDPHYYYYFGFNAGGINRLGYSVPNTYVGNCIGFGQSMVRRDDLMGENGILYAAKAIGDTIKELDRKVLGKAENWIFDWDNLLSGLGLGSDPEPHVVITGSPKVTAYQLDFGWGRPKKIEEISIDKTRAISLFESRDLVGGIEVGLSLPKVKMDIFHSLFQEIF